MTNILNNKNLVKRIHLVLKNKHNQKYGIPAFCDAGNFVLIMIASKL
jgi:hypothetical protein